MPVIRNLPVSLDMSKVLQRQGFKDSSRIRPEMRAMVTELLAEAEGDRLIEPAVTYETYAVTGMGPEQLTLEGNVAINGTLLPSRLPDAKQLVIMVSTIGPKLEVRVRDYSKNGGALRGMLLDGIGSAAADSVAHTAHSMISGEVSSIGSELGKMLSPGMAGFPLTEQSTIMGLAKASQIGVELTSSGLMVPRKSTSRVMGISPRVAGLAQ